MLRAPATRPVIDGVVVHRYRTRVCTADLDAAGIVWFGNFVRLVEAAEDDLLRAAGVTRYSIQADLDVVLTRAEFACSFRSPARADDELDVLLRVAESSSMQVRCEFDIRHVPSERLIASGEFRSVCLKRHALSPVPLPAGVRAAYDRLAAEA